MFKRIKDEIEMKRRSGKIYWRFLVGLKDGLWKLKTFSGKLILRLFVRKEFEMVVKDSIKHRIRFCFFRLIHRVFYNFDNSQLFQYDNKFILASPVINEDVFIDAIRGYLAEYCPKDGDVVIDGGAYHGYFSQVLSFLVGNSGKVICFEPDELNFRELSANVKMLRLRNVILLRKALYSQNGKMSFRSTGKIYSSLYSGLSGKSKAEVVKLDDELKKLGVGKADYIKMDVEGAEIEAVIGAEKTLKNNKVHLAIASYHLLNGKSTSLRLENLLKKMGYSSRTGFKEHLTTYAWRND